MLNYLNHYDYCAQFMAPLAKILDVGSGRGKFLCEMARRGYEAYGVEPNQDYIKESYSKAQKENVYIKIIRGQAENLPFSEGEFDFINCAEVSEHVNNPRKLCEEIFRVLKPGGKCYVSFHNRFGIYDYHFHSWGINWLPRSWAERVLRFFGRHKEDSPAIGRQQLSTMHYYRYGQIRQLLNDVGFKVSDIRVEKIKKITGVLSPAFLFLYWIFLRPLYYNTFHVLLEK